MQKLLILVFKSLGPLLVLTGSYLIYLVVDAFEKGRLVLKSAYSVLSLEAHPFWFWLFALMFVAIGVGAMGVGYMLTRASWFKRLDDTEPK